MSPTRLLTRLAAFSVRRPRSVLAAWIVLAGSDGLDGHLARKH